MYLHINTIIVATATVFFDVADNVVYIVILFNS